MVILEEAAARVGSQLGSAMDELSVSRVVVGLFFTGVKLSDGSGGVCYTPIKDIPEAVCCPTSAGRSFDPTRIPGTPVSKILSSLSSREPIRTAVAIATLNALTAACWQRGIRGDYEMRLQEDAQDVISMDPEKTVVVVGAFLPTLKALKARGGTWWVVEQDPRTLKGVELEHYIPADQAGEVLPRADVAVITGVTLVNHTLEGLLGSIRP